MSWRQDVPDASLDTLRRAGVTARQSVIDVGAGAARLVDRLLAMGFRDLAALDVSEQALAQARAWLGSSGESVTWIAQDVTRWEPTRTYDVWHDRAALHFLTREEDRRAYVERLSRVVPSGGCAVLATFAPDGPQTCSGLRGLRHDAESLSRCLGAGLRLEQERRHDHVTPWGSVQKFRFSLFRRR